jgi:hypothetical protein
MSVRVDLPPDLEQRMRAASPDFDAEGREAMLVEWYRQGKITRYELSLGLELSRFETDAVLKKHNVTEDLPTPEELEEDLRQAQALVGK